MSALGIILVVLLMLAGLAGTFVPLLPAAPLVFASFIVYGLFAGFEQFTIVFWLVQIAFVALTIATDYISGAVGTKIMGGSKTGVWGSIIGGVAGIFIMPPLGIIIGPVVGAMIGEMLQNKPPMQALKIGVGTLVGLAGGAVAKIIIEIAMIIWFIIVIV